MQDDLTELKHAHTNWVDHQYTRTFLNQVKQNRITAFEVLQSACRSTSDPKVAAAYLQWLTLTNTEESILKGPRDEQG